VEANHLIDDRDDRHVALKILTHDSGTAALSFDEVGFLSRINEATPTHPGREHVVCMKRHFKHVGPNGTHVCIAFEVLGPSIREMERLFRGSGLPKVFVKQIAAQMLLVLDFLQRSCGIIHSGAVSRNIISTSTNNNLGLQMLNRIIFSSISKTLKLSFRTISTITLHACMH
jgi:serine/threonine-protein kinase SRPK3